MYLKTFLKFPLCVLFWCVIASFKVFDSFIADLLRSVFNASLFSPAWFEKTTFSAQTDEKQSLVKATTSCMRILIVFGLYHYRSETNLVIISTCTQVDIT